MTPEERATACGMAVKELQDWAQGQLAKHGPPPEHIRRVLHDAFLRPRKSA